MNPSVRAMHANLWEERHRGSSDETLTTMLLSTLSSLPYLF